MVHFLVGPKRKEFTIHKILLLSKCPFWERHLSLDESRQLHQVTSLYHHKDDCSKAFSVLFEWLYRQKLRSFINPVSSQRSPGPQAAPDQHNVHSNTVIELIEVYLLECKLEISDLMNSVINQLGRFYYEKNPWPTQRDIIKTYRSSSKAFRLCKYMTRSYHFMLIAFDDDEVPGSPKPFVEPTEASPMSFIELTEL